MKIGKTGCIHIALLLLLTAGVFRLNMAVGGSIAGPRHLARDLKTPVRTIQKWNLDRDLPARYRILFKHLVRETWRTFFHKSGPRGFYRVYVFWSYIFFSAAAAAFYYLLRRLDFSPRVSFAGALIFLASPPALFAYRFPVHTREDPLAYLLALLGLTAVFASRPALIMLLSLLGALTRETTLVVPLAYLMTSRDAARRKLLVCAPAAAVTLVLWLSPLVSGEWYAPNPVSNYNMRHPLESAAFLFLVFGALWPAAALGWAEMRRKPETAGSPWAIMTATAPAAVLLIVGVHAAFARAREIRISFIAFPWIIPFALAWLVEKSSRLKELMRRPWYWAYAAAVCGLLLVASPHVRLHCPALMAKFRAFGGAAWWNLCLLHSGLTFALVIPLAFGKRAGGAAALAPPRQRRTASARRVVIRAPVVRALAAAIIACGLVFRIAQFAENRSLTSDEAQLAVAISVASFGGLLGTLEYDQAAPPGFLAVEKLLTCAAGNRDYILRIPPLLAGCLSLFLLYALAKRILSPAALLVALALCAASDRLIYYSSEVKQYSFDVAVALLLLLSFAPHLRPLPPARRFTSLALIGAAALWFSHPALFVLTGVGAALAVQYAARGDRLRLGWLCGAALLWTTSFAVLYALTLSRLAADRIYIDFWRFSYMPMPPWRNIGWIAAAIPRMLRNPAGLSCPRGGAFLLCAGFVSLFSRKWQWGAVLLWPFAAAMAASGCERYPFYGRLLLFLVPLAALAIAEGIDRIGSLPAKWAVPSRAAAALAAFILLYSPFASAVGHLASPRLPSDIKPLLAHLHAHRREGDVIYVYYGALSEYRRYSPDFGLAGCPYVRGVAGRKKPENYFRQLDWLRGTNRLWVVFSHIYNWEGVDEEALFLRRLDGLGMRIGEYRGRGSSLYLYHLRQGRR